MPYYVYECSACGEQVEVLRSMSDYQRPPDETEVGEDEDCSHDFQRIIKDVSFMSTERHIGKQELSKNKQHSKIKESYKLESEMFNLPVDKRKDLKKEVKRLRSTKGDS